MAIPLITGSDPETVTIPKNTWVLAIQGVNTGIVKNVNAESQKLFLTYKVTGGAIPTDLTSQPIWKVHTPRVKVGDGVTLRDIFLYAKDTDAVVTLEA